MGGGFEQKGKRTHGHEPQCGDCCAEEGIRGLIGNRKNTVNIKLKNKVYTYTTTGKKKKVMMQTYNHTLFCLFFGSSCVGLTFC